MLAGITRSALGETEAGSIKVWLTQGEQLTEGFFQHTGEEAWSTLFNVKSGTATYGMYGYMPYDESISSSFTEWSADGAVLTLGGLRAIGDRDVCIMTGVSRSVTKPVPAPVRGIFQFSYGSAQTNYLQLLFDHLYSRLTFKIKIGSDYHQLRDITLKSLRVELDGISSVQVIVTLRRYEGIREVAYTTTDAANSSFEVWSGAYRLTEGASESLGGVNMLPVSAVLSGMRLVATYDVYDKQGNLIRENATATNQLSVLSTTLQRGEQKNVTLTVEPTYLYVLSDWDAPTFHVE